MTTTVGGELSFLMRSRVVAMRVQSVMDAQLMFQSRDVGTITIGLFGRHLVWPGQMPRCLPFLIGLHPMN